MGGVSIMINFQYYSPTKFVFGRGTEEKAGELCAAYTKKVMIHYGGGSVKRSGLLDRVKASLKAAGVEYIELGGVQPNPRCEFSMEGVEMCKKEGVGLILAVGGGSVIDSAKFMAVQLCYPDVDAYEEFFINGKVPQKAYPVGCIPTIAAAGSEGSRSAAVSRDRDQLKRAANADCLRPAFSILNPELTFSCPPYQTAAGCVDIMSHILERYFTNTPDVDLTDGFCEAVLKTVIKHAPIVLADPTNYESRAQIQWAAALGHNDIAGVGRVQDWASHRIEHELSAKYDATHGAGLAAVTPAWMKYVYKVNVPRFVKYATDVWGLPNDPFNPEAVALAGIARTEEFFKSLGMPVKASEVGAKKEDYEFLAKHAQFNADGTLGNFKKLGVNDIIEIYKLAE